MFKLIREARPMGRKPHVCEWCGTRIEVGEKHYHYVASNSGDFQNTRMHEVCEQAMLRDMKASGDCCGYEFWPRSNEKGGPPNG